MSGGKQITGGDLIISIIVFVHLILAESIDQDVREGKQFRRAEFSGKTDSDFRGLVDTMRNQREVNWPLNTACVSSVHNRTHQSCLEPNKETKCFTVDIDYNYTEWEGYGEFPRKLQFMRHFPSCWSRLAPLICVGHYRPCSISLKNNNSHLYMLLQVFSTNSCFVMLEACHFIAGNIERDFPSYLNCNKHAQNANSWKRVKTDSLYRDNCKINHYTSHPLLGDLSLNSSQCLWPLVRSEGFQSLNQALPVIDSCYLPCQSPLFESGSLSSFYWISFILFLPIVFLTFVVNIFLIKLAMRSFSFLLINTIGTLFCCTIVAIIFCFSKYQFNQHHILGEFFTCLDGGKLRRFPDGFKHPDGRNNGLCALQAFVLEMAMLFLVWSCFVLICKRYCWGISYSFLPKMNSSLPAFVTGISLLFTLFDFFYFTEMIVDPVNGICHLFILPQHFLSLKMFFYPIAALLPSFLMFYINRITWRESRCVKNHGRLALLSNIGNHESNAFFEGSRTTELNRRNSSSFRRQTGKGTDSNSLIIDENVHWIILAFAKHRPLLHCLWFILIPLRICSNFFLINSEQEKDMIYNFTICYVNQALSNNLPNSDLLEMEKEGSETNPHIRKPWLSRLASANGLCQLELQSLTWYYTFVVITGVHLVLTVIVVLVETFSVNDIENDANTICGDEEKSLEMKEFHVAEAEDEQKSATDYASISSSAFHPAATFTPNNLPPSSQPPPPIDHLPPFPYFLPPFYFNSKYQTDFDLSNRPYYSLPQMHCCQSPWPIPPQQQQSAATFHSAEDVFGQESGGSGPDRRTSNWVRNENNGAANDALRRKRAGSEPQKEMAKKIPSRHRRLFIRGSKDLQKEWKQRRTGMAPSETGSTSIGGSASQRPYSTHTNRQTTVVQPVAATASHCLTCSAGGCHCRILVVHLPYTNELSQFNSPLYPAHFVPHNLGDQFSVPNSLATQIPPNRVEAEAESMEAEEEEAEQGNADENGESSFSGNEPSSPPSEHSETSDSDAFDSDSPDSFEEKQWEEKLRLEQGTSSTGFKEKAPLRDRSFSSSSSTEDERYSKLAPKSRRVAKNKECLPPKN